MRLRFLILALGIFAAGLRAATQAVAPVPAIDFSQAGYGSGDTPIPSVPAVVVIQPSGKDDTETVQAAIDKAACLPPDASGFRGAVVLQSGNYRVGGQLQIRASGIVLRGENATIVATGQSRRSLILVHGTGNDRKLGPALAVANDTSAGTNQLTLTNVDGLAIGTRVVIHRPSTKEWIHALGMDQFTGSFADIRLNWLPRSRDLEWDRTVTALDVATHTITLDTPITTALDARYGGATVHVLSWPGRLHDVGLENLTLRSEFDPANPQDEEHAWLGIQIENTENAWVRDVTAQNFVSAAVWLGASTKAITVQDCRSEMHVGADAGWRRFGFYAGGQLILVQRCTANAARQPFLAGLCAAGPNVFLDCTADRATGDSGSIESWASGILFDHVKIEGGDLVLGNLGARWQAAGWNAANSIAWNCTVRNIVVENPPGAINLNFSDPAKPSLYRAQLTARLGKESDPKNRNTKSYNAPISETRPPISNLRPLTSNSATLSITDGRFTFGGKTLFGNATSNAWWKGQTIPARAAELGWSVTRWVPGRIGPGLTEDLAELAARLAASGNSLVQVWPGLWYDRRRDDHLTITRENAETWAPFYESPWARSGQGSAADGLSKYDLTKFNPWYWSRLRDFATECARHDMVLYHHFYNHHNLVEAAAHWAEFPWRPANCLQETGFTEPPPFTNNGTRIGVVNEFYDINHPVRREMHRLFIWHGLDVFADQPNVVHTLAFQFAGPLSFQEFFLDTVAEWQTARGKRVHIALNTSKAVTDAILADPVRSQLVDVIDQRYWQYLANGSIFAPDSGGVRAFREDRVAAFGKDAIPPGTPELVYKQVREYRDRFPTRAIIAGHAGQGPIPILMAGGALPLLADYSSAQPLKADRDDRALIQFIRERLGPRLSELKPSATGNDTWLLADTTRNHCLYYSPSGKQLTLVQATNVSSYTGIWFDPKNGTMQDAQLTTELSIPKPTNGAWFLLIQR
ncbi:MAG: hypothetical protein IPP19_05690 [Verrucomicrobia bacterium]|nr:hypothetical protein [Verrucomicrobiota bacterium]